MQKQQKIKVISTNGLDFLFELHIAFTVCYAMKQPLLASFAFCLVTEIDDIVLYEIYPFLELPF